MTPAEKDAAVREVLQHAKNPPLAPSLIRDLARYSGAVMTNDSLRRALVRIGAVRHPGGLYSAPPVPAADDERPKALPAYICCACHKRKTDYAGSRAKGSLRACRQCVETP